MRLTSSAHGSPNLPSGMFGRRTIKELAAIYDDKITRGEHGRLRTLSVDGGLLEVKRRVGEPETSVRILGLSTPLQAARWLALQAYGTRAGESPLNAGSLIVEVPGLRAEAEWNARFKTGPLWGDGKFCAYRAVASHDDTREAAVKQVVASEKNEVTLLRSQGDDAQLALHVLDEHYQEMVFHTDSDPHATVARTVGMTCLDQFDRVWEEAMRQGTPVAAGQLVMTSFLDMRLAALV
jgi:hypothetical protein